MKKLLPVSQSRRLRRLSDEEIELWLSVAASVNRRRDSSLPERIAVPAPPPPPPETIVAQTPGTSAPRRAASLPAQPPLAPLERRLKQKLSRGQMTADAAIDLHGFRQAEAHGALRRFLQRSQSEGARVVLVVTGKGGRPSVFLGAENGRPGRPDAILGADFGEGGVLRRAVPLWLNMPDFRALVVGFEEAARQHGGSGALYVRLRRLDRSGTR